MGFSQLFREGMAELKRRSALFKEKRNFSGKEKQLARQVLALGKTAWKEKVDISGYGNAQTLLSNAQEEIDKLSTNLEQWEKQKLDLEQKIRDARAALTSLGKEQEGNFRLLGDKLTGSQSVPDPVKEDFDAVHATRKSIETSQLSIQELEHKGSPETHRAMWNMIAVVGGILAALVIIIVLIFSLLGGPGETNDIPSGPYVKPPTGETAMPR